MSATRKRLRLKKRLKRVWLKIRISWILIFGGVASVGAKSDPILPNVNGFAPQKPYQSRPNPQPNPGKGGFFGKGPQTGTTPSGYRLPHKPVKNRGLNGGANGMRNAPNPGNPGGGGDGPNSPEYDSTSKNSKKVSQAEKKPIERDYSGSSSKKPKKPKKQKDEETEETEKKKKKRRKRKKKDQELPIEIVNQRYEDLLLKLKQKGYIVNIPKARFLALAINQDEGVIDEKAIFEAEGGLELEAQGRIKNLRRPDNEKVKLDFQAEFVDSNKTVFIDHKGMKDFQTLSEEGKDVTNFPTHRRVAYNMGTKSVSQKKRYIGLDKGPKSMSDVIHLYNFEKIRNRAEVENLINAVIDGAEEAGYTDGMLFINYT